MSQMKALDKDYAFFMDKRRIFFYRICGAGMGACAGLLKEKGFCVEGGDETFYPPMSDRLKRLGIPCHSLENLDENFLKSFDLIVVGNAVCKGSPDAVKIENSGVDVCSFPAILGGLLLKGRKVVGVAGTHGKTTTTYFAAQVFEKMGFSPGYFIGGVPLGGESSHIGEGDYFFIESDEYDSSYFEKFPKFHSYFIDDLIATSLEFDHADIFDSLEDIEKEFERLFCSGVQKRFLCGDYAPLRRLATKGDGETFFYGENSESGPVILEESEKGTVFELKFKGKKYRFRSNIFGLYNVCNLSAVLLFALSEGVSPLRLKDAILDLKFVKRRQENRGFYGGALVIDDFAHHPRSVMLTVDLMKKRYPDKRIKVVFEPSSSTSRSDLFQEEFSEGLSLANFVFLVKNKRSTKARGRKNMDFDFVARALREHSVDSVIVEELDVLKSSLENHADDKSLFLFLSNGNCLGLWESDFVEKLSMARPSGSVFAGPLSV